MAGAKRDSSPRGPCLDAYALSPRRSRELLSEFIRTFTRDGSVILGLSVQYETGGKEDEERANALLRELMVLSNATLGLVAVELPPPLDASEFEQLVRAPHGHGILSVSRVDRLKS